MELGSTVFSSRDQRAEQGAQHLSDEVDRLEKEGVLVEFYSKSQRYILSRWFGFRSESSAQECRKALGHCTSRQSNPTDVFPLFDRFEESWKCTCITVGPSQASMSLSLPYLKIRICWRLLALTTAPNKNHNEFERIEQVPIHIFPHAIPSPTILAHPPLVQPAPLFTPQTRLPRIHSV